MFELSQEKSSSGESHDNFAFLLSCSPKSPEKGLQILIKCILKTRLSLFSENKKNPGFCVSVHVYIYTARERAQK